MLNIYQSFIIFYILIFLRVIGYYKKYIRSLDKALEIYNFHKITNYILVAMGIILISFGLINGTVIESLQSINPSATLPKQSSATN